MNSFISEEIERYAHDHTTPEPDLFCRLRDETYRDMSCPQMQVGRIEGTFLKLLVRLIGAKRVVEIGMFTGYSGLMMAATRSPFLPRPDRARGRTRGAAASSSGPIACVMRARRPGSDSTARSGA